MKWMLEPRFEKLTPPVNHRDPILLVGSCFTGNMGNHLSRLFFKTMANPTGILFDPFSITRHLSLWMENKPVEERELIFANGLYQHPDFHSDFSDLEPGKALTRINSSITGAHHFLKDSRYLILTLGSAFAYRFKEDDRWVANCHKFSAEKYDKVLLETEEIVTALKEQIRKLQTAFPHLQILFTISPVRHIRDGVVANNRSKGRLVEAVHRIQESIPGGYYFPAYEWVLDVLRDHRWYDIDLVHPNYAATQSVFELFCDLCMDEWTRTKLEDLNKLRIGMEHRPRFPETQAHRQFMESLEEKRLGLQKEMPWIDFK